MLSVKTKITTDTLSPLVAAMKQRLDVGLEPVLDQIAQVLRSAFEGQFVTAGAYGGTPWPMLALTTMLKKRGNSATILVDQGTLRASLTEQSAAYGYAKLLDKWTVAVGTDDPVAIYHQYGTRKMPKRQLAPDEINTDDLNQIEQIITNYFVRGA